MFRFAEQKLAGAGASPFLHLDPRSSQSSGFPGDVALRPGQSRAPLGVSRLRGLWGPALRSGH